MIITIDGPAGSGKSTVSKKLAQLIGFIPFESGAMFRAVTAFLHAQNFDIHSITEKSTIPDFEIAVQMRDNKQHVLVNNVDYTSVLRENHISQLVPFVAVNYFCRQKIDQCQKNFCSNHNVVMEGRDLGTHVFPNADVKFYLDCSSLERAKRRFKEEQEKNPNITLEEIKQQIEERDHLDKTRKIAPLSVPINAICVDSTNMDIDEVVLTLHGFVKDLL